MKAYYIHIPGWVYAMTCYGTDEADARRRFREAQGFNRLPKGTGYGRKQMTNEFKKGDKVVCKRNDGYMLTVGKAYTVEVYTPESNTKAIGGRTFPAYVTVKDDGGHAAMAHASRFIPAAQHRQQFPTVNSQYGAPMGRHGGQPDLTQRRSVRLFRVNLDTGGYDDGGAYWGHGEPLYCAMDADGDFSTVRARNRTQAAMLLDIPRDALRMGLNEQHAQCYIYALLDGRAPMPKGMTKQSVQDWYALRASAPTNH